MMSATYDELLAMHTDLVREFDEYKARTVKKEIALRTELKVMDRMVARLERQLYHKETNK